MKAQFVFHVPTMNTNDIFQIFGETLEILKKAEIFINYIFTVYSEKMELYVGCSLTFNSISY